MLSRWHGSNLSFFSACLPKVSEAARYFGYRLRSGWREATDTLDLEPFSMAKNAIVARPTCAKGLCFRL